MGNTAGPTLQGSTTRCPVALLPSPLHCHHLLSFLPRLPFSSTPLPTSLPSSLKPLHTIYVGKKQSEASFSPAFILLKEGREGRINLSCKPMRRRGHSRTQSVEIPVFGHSRIGWRILQLTFPKKILFNFGDLRNANQK